MGFYVLSITFSGINFFLNIDSLNHGILRTVLSLNDLDDVEYHNINGINQIYHRVSPQTRIIGIYCNILK